MTTELAFLGLGGMGAGMAHRLAEQGFALTVYNRTPSKAQPLVAAGATAAATPAEAAEKADAVLLSLSDEAAVDAVLFEAGGVQETLRPKTLVIDTSTVSPAYSRQVTQRLAALGARRVEACVLGNPHQARAGELRVLAAGDADAVDAAMPVLEVLGKQVVRLGPVGTAATTKLAFNSLLAAQVAALAEAVQLGVQAGLDRDMLLAAMAGSGFSSPVLAFRAGLMRERRYEPAAFRARLMDKDLRLVLAEAARLGVGMPVAEAVARWYGSVVEAGDGDRDAAVIVERPAPANPGGAAP
ncbi:3-hydroxyisobutyrate dehydrogenase [Carbonactinospora thermoautotrophica]|uniref:3-hydroxyisobutyrate dehydrogenase n=1 Tax=Carbonactinospora thermoautotrophica TaxID=1469144 RepID=A0A132N3F9_9ACTN|nr:NAD(P)-dependent oxidoreductase [Carbonactinospora thermoautotrophica]KWX04659.1 3-hydroxyisobutyrate dehydrogenase [Carbonactinospora thermoautotrophica]KWX09524.1 3-hydroxyisobutyrate dehydrogenase [Carbonactinospora thermoautotrophica]